MTDSYQSLGTRKIIGDYNFSEIKVQKNASSKIRNRLKLGKISRKDMAILYKNVKKKWMSRI